MVVSSFYEK